MTYRVIATILTEPKGPTHGLDAAIALAARMDAHLDIHIAAVSHTDPHYSYLGADAMIIAERMRETVTEREELETWVNERMKGEVVRWSMQGAVVQSAGLTGHLARNLRFCDLVVLPRPYQGADLTITLVEACLFAASRPVLMIPEGCGAPQPGGHIQIGWNDGDEALAAARDALPLLREAEQTDICIIDPPSHAPDRSDPGGELAQYLMRHGAKPEVAIIAKTEPRVGDVLMRHAREVGAEAIVTGAYSHSRLREAILGGATRSLLQEADRPILMSR